jgi:hypothetical protein
MDEGLGVGVEQDDGDREERREGRFVEIVCSCFSVRYAGVRITQ